MVDKEGNPQVGTYELRDYEPVGGGRRILGRPCSGIPLPVTARVVKDPHAFNPVVPSLYCIGEGPK